MARSRRRGGDGGARAPARRCAKDAGATGQHKACLQHTRDGAAGAREHPSGAAAAAGAARRRARARARSARACRPRHALQRRSASRLAAPAAAQRRRRAARGAAAAPGARAARSHGAAGPPGRLLRAALREHLRRRPQLRQRQPQPDATRQLTSAARAAGRRGVSAARLRPGCGARRGGTTASALPPRYLRPRARACFFCAPSPESITRPRNAPTAASSSCARRAARARRQRTSQGLASRSPRFGPCAAAPPPPTRARAHHQRARRQRHREVPRREEGVQRLVRVHKRQHQRPQRVVAKADR
jgi:hypothetical protein